MKRWSQEVKERISLTCNALLEENECEGIICVEKDYSICCYFCEYANKCNKICPSSKTALRRDGKLG